MILLSLSMTTDRHLFTLDPRYKQLFSAALCATVFTSCDNSQLSIGQVNLESAKNKSLVFRLPPNPQAQTGWRFRFGIEPQSEFSALRDTDEVTVYLKNDDNVSVGLLTRIEKTFTEIPPGAKLSIQPGEKVEIFHGSLSKLILIGRGEEATMVFDPAMRNVDLTLIFVPQLAEGKKLYDSGVHNI